MTGFLRNLVREVGDKYTTIAGDGESAAEFSGFIDTGSYIMNAVISGSLYGGVADNKVTAFAGESTTGKTFFILAIAGHFLSSRPDAGVVIYDTEAAITRKMLEDRGIDPNRIIIAEPTTIQEFRTHVLRMLESYEKIPQAERPPLMFILDSLGQLSTTKEMTDSGEGKETKDMTKAGLIRGAFRVIRLKLARAKVPMLVTQHVYAAIGGNYPVNEIAGGGGLKYASDTIAMLSKKREKGQDALGDEQVIGNVVHVRMYKSRLSRENRMVDTLITYEGGLDRYYGLLQFAEQTGVFKKVGPMYLIGDKRYYGKHINENPEKFFTEDVLQELEKHANRLFRYGMVPEEEETGGPELLTESEPTIAGKNTAEV